MHEFTHKLDEEKVAIDSLLKTPVVTRCKAISLVVTNISLQFVDDVIDFHAVISPVKLFTVVTKNFFEKPHQLDHQHSKLYEYFKFA